MRRDVCCMFYDLRNYTIASGHCLLHSLRIICSAATFILLISQDEQEISGHYTRKLS